MWIFTQLGFASAVQDRRDDTQLMVRFRDQEDAAKYAKAIVAANPRRVRLPKVWRDDRADYLWRLVCPKHQWAAMLAAQTEDVDYDNFKSMMHARAENWSGSELMGIWSITNEHQRKNDNHRRRRNRQLIDYSPRQRYTGSPNEQHSPDDQELVLEHDDRWRAQAEPKDEEGPW